MGVRKGWMLFSLLFSVSIARAWVYPEHRQIALLAIQDLAPENRLLLEQLWKEARRGYDARLTESVIDPTQGLKPSRLDYASWFAIGGDHSCSSKDLLHNVLQTKWILEVADVAARLKKQIAESKNSVQHDNAIRESDISLLKADPQYATRAGSNNVHFLLARKNVDTDLEKYLGDCLAAGAELNALGTYAWYHLQAMIKALRYSSEVLSPEEKSALVLSALADEAFALHFLEDAFAAGHMAGTWGAASVRKGTHDYYNERGIEVVTWEGKRMIIKGDAYMTASDAEHAAAAVQMSLEQFLNAASGKSIINDKQINGLLNETDGFNVCQLSKNGFQMETSVELLAVAIKTPVPGLAIGIGELPRFRSELGSFIGVSNSLCIRRNYGGFGETQDQKGMIAGLDAALRFGFGIEGLLNKTSDGLVFIQAGWKIDASSVSRFGTQGDVLPSTTVAEVPSRTALTLRWRMPFYLIPGDLLLAAPLLYFISPAKLEKMAAIAANGGLISWQSAVQTKIGRFQFILGREVGISFYGFGASPDEVLIPVNLPRVVLITYKSTQFDFPILEYRPFRAFSLDQTSAMIVQFSGGFDIPHGAALVGTPDREVVPELKTVWYLGLRVSFNWRHYN